MKTEQTTSVSRFLPVGFSSTYDENWVSPEVEEVTDPEPDPDPEPKTKRILSSWFDQHWEWWGFEEAARVCGAKTDDERLVVAETLVAAGAAPSKVAEESGFPLGAVSATAANTLSRAIRHLDNLTDEEYADPEQQLDLAELIADNLKLPHDKDSTAPWTILGWPRDAVVYLILSHGAMGVRILCERLGISIETALEEYASGMDYVRSRR